LLAKTTQHADIVLSTPVSLRTHAELKPVIGHFLNQVLLRTDLGDNPSLGTLMERVRGTVLGTYAHQDFPLGSLGIDRLDDPRFLQARFMLIPKEADLARTLGPLTITPYAAAFNASAESRFWFSMGASEDAATGGMRILFKYRSDLFRPETVQRMSSTFLRIIDAIAVNLRTKIADV
jgi:non-ribosomal peptide synthetase component F